MKRQINLICSIIALFCFVSMYMPVIAPRYPAGEYYAPEGSYESDYYYTGNYYYAREYWSITRYAFASRSVVGRVALSLTQAMLLLWAILSVRGEAGKTGLAAAVIEAFVAGFFIIRMLMVRGSCRWGVLAVMALVMAAGVVMAANAITTNR